MALYTIILDLGGGTYVSQVRARSPHMAARSWAENFSPSVVPGLGRKAKATLLEEMKDERPVPLEGFSNVWCSSGFVRGKLALVNIVLTREDS